VAKRDFLTITDFSREEIDKTLALAAEMKTHRFEYQSFGGGSAALIFKKPSLRTRISFDVGVHELGGHPIYITDQEIGLGKRESTYDVGQVLSRFVRLIEIRTFEHQEVVDLANAASVPLINGLTNEYHPCQIVADMMTILECKKRLDGLTITYLGDGNNIVHSWLKAAELFEFNFRIGTVETNDPDAEILAHAKQVAGSRVSVIRDPVEAVSGADVLYTDVWASMGEKHLADQNRARLRPYQINDELLSHAAKDAIVLHCLPAVRGEEITDSVMDGPQSRVFDEAENRLHAQKALMHMLLTECAG